MPLAYEPQRMIRLTKKEKLIKVSIALTTLTVYLQKMVHSFCANRNRPTKCTVLMLWQQELLQYQHQVEGNVTGSSCFFSRSRKSRARGGCNAPSIRKCSTNIALEEGARSANRPTNCFFLSALHQLEIKGKVLWEKKSWGKFGLLPALANPAGRN